jgi:type I restriction enzyme R subunit
MNKAANELGFEQSIETHLLGNGWLRVPAGGFDARLGLVPDELVAFLQASQPDEWAELVLRAGGGNEAKTAEKVVEYVAKQADARGVVRVLRGETRVNGVAFRCAFFAPASTITPALWERYTANRVGVARQVHYSTTDAGLSVDLVLLVNGLPVATAELKNPLTGQRVEDAMRQYRYDRDPSQPLFAHRAVVHFAVDPDQVYMTTRLAGKATRFLPFNQGSGGPGAAGGAGNPANPAGYRTAYLWERVWAREAWLDLFASFVHDDEETGPDGAKTGRRRTLFPRYHQWDAVRRMLADTRATGPGTDRLIMHSAGSGKSNTIAWLAHSLSRLHTPGTAAELTTEVVGKGLGPNEPVFHKVVVVTDRRALDAHLQATVGSFEHTPGVLVRIGERQTANDLKAALESHAARIIITTLQKFPVVAAYAAEQGGQVAGKRFAVLIDEAHSSTSGESMKGVKQVLAGPEPLSEAEALAAAELAEAAAEAGAADPVDAVAASMRARGRQTNLSFYAFTATPKPKTRELFGTRTVQPDGTEVFAPFHLYSMRQAIEEGFILDVLRNYTTYATYYKLANSSPEDPEVDAGKASAALARFVSLHPTSMAQKAEIIVEHFRTKTAQKIGGRAKAMVVTRSRLHAVRTKQAIDAYIAAKRYDTGERPLQALVAFSGTVTDPASPVESFTEAFMNGFGEAQLPRRFGEDDYQVLVVAEKYQTGFDQPLLHTMYVDKPLAGVKAVQTLSRLNRIHPDKDDTFVLDFANDPEVIAQAFAEFYEEATAAPTDPNLLYGMRTRLLEAGVLDEAQMRAAVAALLTGRGSYQRTVHANVDPAVARHAALGVEDRDAFRDTLVRYLRAYTFIAQTIPWHDPDLELLFLYGKALAAKLPTGESEPLPMLDDSVLLTHLRTEARQVEADHSIDEGETEPGKSLPGEGAGRQHERPREHLSVLIDTLNQRYGMNLTDADKVWFEQQKSAIRTDPQMRAVALHNDRDNYLRVLQDRADAMILDRHQANGELFAAYFDKPGFREALLAAMAATYEEIRAEGVG